MLFWIIASCATALLAVTLLLPLMRSRATVAGGHSHDVEVYRDQLKEVDRDQAQGLISADEAGYAKAEIGRRLIASAEKAESETKASRGGRHIITMTFVIVALPAIGVSLYLLTGSPGLPSQPLQARLDHPNGDINILIAKMETHLMRKPDDGAGWDLIAPIYMRTRRPDDAANAYRNAIRLLGPNAKRFSGLGEALVVSNNGLITDEARNDFRKAHDLDKDDARSEFYLALALEQQGSSMEALAAFKSLAKTSKPDAPWQPIVARHIAALEKGDVPAMPANPNAPKNPSAADVAAAKNMSAGDRQQMILGMVAGLAEKLKENPDNFEGWMRLIRSYAMLKDEAKASGALKHALAAFPADTEKGQQLQAMARSLGVNVEAAKP